MKINLFSEEYLKNSFIKGHEIFFRKCPFSPFTRQNYTDLDLGNLRAHISALNIW